MQEPKLLTDAAQEPALGLDKWRITPVQEVFIALFPFGSCHDATYKHLAAPYQCMLHVCWMLNARCVLQGDETEWQRILFERSLGQERPKEIAETATVSMNLYSSSASSRLTQTQAW